MKKFPIRSKRIKKQDILNGDRIKYFSIIKYLNEPLTLKNALLILEYQKPTSSKREKQLNFSQFTKYCESVSST